MNGFPNLISLSKRPEQVARAIENLQAGLRDRKIFNQDFKSCCSSINEGVYQMRGKMIADPFFYGEKRRSIPEELRDIWDASIISSLYNVPALQKRLSKCKCQHPAREVMNAFISELMPLVDLVRDLKPFVVKGRRPAEPKPPREPTGRQSRYRGTCQLCEKLHKLPNGHLAKHGYEVAGFGFFNGVCWGAEHPPFEESCDFLRDNVLPRLWDQLKRLQVFLSEIRKDTAENRVWIRYRERSTGKRYNAMRWLRVDVFMDQTPNGDKPFITLPDNDKADFSVWRGRYHHDWRDYGDDLKLCCRVQNREKIRDVLSEIKKLRSAFIYHKSRVIHWQVSSLKKIFE